MGANRFLDPDSASARLYADARRVIPGGTSKANFDVRPHPFYFVSGRGCRVTDADGIERLDALNNFTALIHGHAFEPVTRRVSEQLARGTAFAASTPEEIALARLLVERVPGLEQIRFGNSGTESVFMHMLDAGVLVGANGLGCLSTPMGEREIDEIIEAAARALSALGREG